MFKTITTLAASLILLTSTAGAQTAVDFREALQMTFPATVGVSSDDANVAQKRLRMNNRIPRMPMELFNGNNPLAMINAGTHSTLNAGFAISADKVVAQVSSDNDEVTVTTIDKSQHIGKVIARDHVTGLCVIEVEDAELVSLVVGAGSPEPGLPVVATWIGMGGIGMSHSGMISSAPNTSEPRLGFVQHIDSASQIGATGGPVVDAAGVLVGITMAGEDGSIVCIPSAQLTRLIDAADEASPSDLHRGMAGIRFSTDVGAVVNGVNDDSPAANAELQVGDLITQVGDYTIGSYEDVIAAVAMARAGDSLQITIQRGDETLVRTLTLGKHPKQKITLSALPEGQMKFQQQAWQLKDGKLVPLDLDKDGGADFALPKHMQEMLKGWQGGDFQLPRDLRFPRIDGLQIERSETEEALQELEAEKDRQAAKIKELTDKIRELEAKQ